MNLNFPSNNRKQPKESLMKTGVRVVMLSTLLAPLALAVGCATHIYPVPPISLHDQPDVYVMEKKINRTVKLNVTDQLRGAKFEGKFGGNTHIIPFGLQIGTNACELAAILFQNIVSDSDSTAPTTSAVDAVLTPRVITSERTWDWNSMLTVVMEWKLTKPNGDIIWADTVKGNGTVELTFDWSGCAATQTVIMLKDLFKKSFQAIKESPEIRNFATKPQ
jgi:hypothetical protein